MNFTKSLKNNLFVIVLLLVSNFVFANRSLPALEVFDAKNKTFTISTHNATLNKVSLRILDNAGAELHQEDITIVNNFKRLYNLSNLPNGTYQIELEDNQTIRKQIVIISFNDMEISSEHEVNIFKPTIKTKGKDILFNMLVLDKSDVDFVIIDEKGLEVHSEVFKDLTTIHKQFKLSKLSSGRYTIRIENKNRVIRETVNLK